MSAVSLAVLTDCQATKPPGYEVAAACSPNAQFRMSGAVGWRNLPLAVQTADVGAASTGLTDSGTPFVGALLVATPMIEEPTFRRSVILLLDHSEEGSLGVVLNDPSNLEVDDVVPEWSDLLAPVVAVGGPVQTDAGVAVARVASSETAALPEAVRVVSGPWAVVDLDAQPESLRGHIAQARLFLGYAGWGPGQLDTELATQSWWVVESHPGDLDWGGVDDRRVAWRSVLMRQPNELRLAADYPDNATFN